MKCTDCLHWIPETRWEGCGEIKTTFPAHCPDVRDPDQWVADDCSLYEKRTLGVSDED